MNQLQYLNLQKSKITSQGLCLLEKSPRSKSYICLDLAFTGIEADQFDDFMLTDKTPFPPNLKYMWIENTYNLTDKKFSELQFWNKFSSEKFDFMEMLQSKQRRLSLSLKHLTNKEIRNHVFKKSYIQLDIFQQIQSETLIKLFNECFAKEYSTFKELKYIYLTFRKQNYQAIKNCFNWDKDINVQAVCEKFCFRINSIPSEYQGAPVIKLISKNVDSTNQTVKDAIQFESYHYLTAMSYEYILRINKLICNQTILKLELENTDISGNLFFQLCESIVGTTNYITDVSLKGIKSIRDEHIINMMFDVQVDEIIQSFQEIKQSYTTSKLSEKQSMKEQKKKEIENKIKLFSEKKKFPYLVQLIIEGTKVTQYSLCQILKTIPFNMSFRIEHLFKQYSESKYCTLDDHVLHELSQSLYLQNFVKLNLEKIQCTSASLNKIFKSPKSVNIKEIHINTTNISEDAFITLANSTNLPKLQQIKILEDDKILVKSYHYFLRAQYLSMNLKIDDLMKKQEVVDTSQFIQAIINSFYMNNIKFIEIHNCSKFMNQIKSLFKLSRFTGFIDRVVLEDVKDSAEYKDVWITIAQSKCFPRLQQLVVKQLEIRDHLVILLKQKYKPQFDIESLLKDNKSLIDDQIIVQISELPHLLNSKEIDLSDLHKIRPRAWEAFANSKYVGNLKTINFSYCTLMSQKTENDLDIIEYYRQDVNAVGDKTKCQSLFQKNNFFNLDKIIITNNKGLHISEIDYILQAIKKRHVSVRFNFEDVFMQLIDQVKPLLIEYAQLKEKEQKQDYQEDEYDKEEQLILQQIEDDNDDGLIQSKQELIMYLWNIYIPELHELFDKYFLKTREWYNTRHTTLDLTYYQFLIRFENFQNVFTNIHDLSCIQHLKFYNYGFDSVFSSEDMKFLNLKTVNILDLFSEKNHIIDPYGAQLDRVLHQRFIKPYYFDINFFIENYKINDYIQNLFLNSVYMESSEHFIIYLKYINKEQIEKIFKNNTHFSASTIHIRDTQSDDTDIDKQAIADKQELFITLLAKSNSFSNIRELETSQPINLNCIKLLIKSSIFYHSFDIQKLVGQTEVDPEYFDILYNSRYFQNLTYLLIPKLLETQIQTKPQQTQQTTGKGQVSAVVQASIPQKGGKFKIDFEKFNINKINRLTHIKVIDSIEDPDFLLNLFSMDNIRFNSSISSAEKVELKKLDSFHFAKMFSNPMPGYDWSLILSLLHKNLGYIDASVYKAMLLNQSACFFLNHLEIPDNINKETAEEIIGTITTTMEQIKYFMPQLQLNKLVIRSFPENSTKILEFFKKIQNLKQIEFKEDIKFGLEEAKTLLHHTSNTNLAETVLNWILPNLNLVQLKSLSESLKVDKEIPQNVSYLDFTGNKYLISKAALEQIILNLRSNKKKGSKNEEEEENEGDNEEGNNEEGEEEDKEKGNKNEGEAKNEGEEENQPANEDEEGEQDEDNKGEKDNEENEKQDLDKKQLVQLILEYQRNSITENDLSEFLSIFQGAREFSFKKTPADIYHLVKIKKLEHANLLHFVNFEDCTEIKNCVAFAILLNADLKPWFQLNKYLDHIPIGKTKHYKKFMKTLFDLEFFKHNFKYMNFDFVLKGNQTSNSLLLSTFEYIIKRRINNLDITAMMQNLPLYMKQAVNDNHIEKICKDYGCVHYLQPEKYPQVQYGFNHILQQKNIPTSIRLMYLLNDTFQKKISASSLSLIYQLALESEKLKLKNIVKQNDEQLKLLLEKMKRQALKRRQTVIRKKTKFERQLQAQKDRKYARILNAVGKKIPEKKQEKKKKEQEKQQLQVLQKFNTLKQSNFKTGKTSPQMVDSPLLSPSNKVELLDVDPFDDGEVDNNDDEIDKQLNERQLQEQEENQKKIDLLDENGNNDEEDENEKKNDDDEEDGGVGGEENIEDEENNKNDEKEDEELFGNNEEEGQNGEENFGDQDEGQNEENLEDQLEQPMEENEKEDDFNNQYANRENIDENTSFKNRVQKTMKIHALREKNLVTQTQQLNTNDEVMGSKINEDDPQINSPFSSKVKKVLKINKNFFGMFSPKQKKVEEKPKEIEHSFEGSLQIQKPSLKGNAQRTYNNQVALRLHKELVNLHLMSEKLKNEDRRIIQLAKKTKEIENQLDLLEFEIQLIEINKRDNNYEIENLFSFIEALNLGENSHLNIYGLNFYISQHIQPWIKLNQNINELKEGKNRADKIKNIFEQKDDEDLIGGVINPDHVLDDKLFEHLSYLIEERLKQLREINLRGLNVSDDFAEKFSLILGDDTKLTHLNLLDLSQNRRLSPFGLKFLFSSIVNRIPEGFKIVISATGNDADHLRLQIEILEKSIMKEAVWVVKKQKKEIAKYIQKNRRKLNTHQDNKVMPLDKRPSLDDLDSAENHVPQTKKLNLELFDPNIPKMFDEDDEEQKEDSENGENERKKIQIDETKKELQELDYQSDASDDENKKKNDEDGDLKFLFMQEQTLDKRIVRKIEKDKTYKDKVSRLRSLQNAYKKALEECGSGGMAQQVDARMIVQNVVNLGLYDAINLVVKDTWKKKKLTIILLSIIFLPLTIFHLIMLSTYRINYFFKKNTITLRFQSQKKQKDTLIVELDKLIPDNIENTDFYFDEDVAQIDVLLSRNKLKRTPIDLLRRQGRLIAKYILNPLKINFEKTYEEISDTKAKEKHILRYVDAIFWFHIIFMILGICVAYPYYLINYYLPKYQPSLGCGTYPILFDTPFFVTVAIVIGLEAAVLNDIQNIIVSKKIFNLKSLTVIVQLYNSFMIRYNMYSNMIFAHNIYYCDKAPDLGLISIIFLHVQIAWTVLPALGNFFSIWMTKRRAMKKAVHNTEFINLFTQLGQQLDFIGLSFVLDRFSTSSTITLNWFFLPNFLKNIKVPQILLTKFQKLVYLDFPQISILLIFNLRKNSTENLLSFENIRVILTTMLSLYSSLSQAWQAHPSIFRTYQMQDYLKFRQDTPQIYKIKIGTEEKFEHLKIQDVLSKTFTFNQKFTLKFETAAEKKAKLKKEKDRKEKQKKQQQQDANSRVASSQAGSVVSDSRSQAQMSQKSIGSQASIQSNKSSASQNNNNLTSTSDKRKIITPENFQQQLIEFIKKSDKFQLQEEEEKQE